MCRGLGLFAFSRLLSVIVRNPASTNFHSSLFNLPFSLANVLAVPVLVVVVAAAAAAAAAAAVFLNLLTLPSGTCSCARECLHLKVTERTVIYLLF